MSKLTFQQRGNQNTRIPVGQRRATGGKALEDNRAAFAAKQLKQDQTAQLTKEEDELLKDKSGTKQLAKKDEEEIGQAKFSDRGPPVQREQQPAKPNNTGLPDKLKNGIEALSGMSMDNVKVHYNSAKPQQLNALAYAQGTDIHVGPGQEKHLPHEAWHVVQQAQGRVKPTIQMKEGVPVNDDEELEREADVMGTKAVQTMRGQNIRSAPLPLIQQSSIGHSSILGQRFIEANSLSKKHRIVEPAPPLVDLRPEAIAQKKLQMVANNSHQAKRTAQLLTIANLYKQQTKYYLLKSQDIESTEPIQRMKLTLSGGQKAEKKQFGGPYGHCTYFETMVTPWLASVQIDHPFAKHAAENALILGQAEIYKGKSRFDSWDGIVEIVNSVNQVIDSESIEFDADVVHDESNTLDLEQEESNTTPELKLNVTSEGSNISLEIEHIMSTGTRYFKSTKDFLNQDDSVIAPLKQLLKIAELSKNPDELLQIHRLIGTTEFNELLKHKNTKKLAQAIVEFVVPKQELFSGSLLSFINPKWGVTEIIKEKLGSSEILDARHGVDTLGANPINSERLGQTIGELVLMQPILDEIFLLGQDLDLIKSSAAHFAPLILRVLEGSVRRYKAQSILELLADYKGCFSQIEEFLKTKKVTSDAYDQIQNAMRMALSGEGHRAKEQKKMLVALIQHLNIHDNDQCVEYEPDSGEANYDMGFHDLQTGKHKVIEVESIPADRRNEAHSFYLEKYVHKLQSIKRAKTSELFLMIPPITKLPAEEIEKIKMDQDLKISNIDHIKPIQKRSIASPFKDHRFIVQRRIDLTKENQFFPNAQAALTNLIAGPLSGHNEKHVRAAVDFMDSNNERYSSYKDFAASAQFFVNRYQTVVGWNSAAIPEMEPSEFCKFDFFVMDHDQLNAFTAQQHKRFSDFQVDWFNAEVGKKGLSGTKEAIEVHAASERVGTDKVETEVYTGTRFYHEKQKQGWCGKHALNAFFGKGLLSEKDLFKLATEYAGDAEKALQHITLEHENPGSIGDISLPFLLWVLKKITGRTYEQFNLSELSPKKLEDLLESVDSMIMTGDKNTLYPGEVIHKRGHYAAAKKDMHGNWWVINSTVAKQFNIDPKNFSKTLQIIIEVDPKIFINEAQEALVLAQQIEHLNFENWKDSESRKHIVDGIHKLLAMNDKYHKATGANLIPNVSEINQHFSSSIAEELVMSEDFSSMTNVFAGKEEDFTELSNLIKQVPKLEQ